MTSNSNQILDTNNGHVSFQLGFRFICPFIRSFRLLYIYKKKLLFHENKPDCMFKRAKERSGARDSDSEQMV